MVYKTIFVLYILNMWQLIMLSFAEAVRAVCMGLGSKKMKQWIGWVIWANNLQSAWSMSSSVSKSVHVTPRCLAFLDIASSLCLSSAMSWTAKAGSAYVISDMIRPVKSVWSAWTFMAWDLSCDSKYKRWFICIIILSRYAEMDKVNPVSCGKQLSGMVQVICILSCWCHCCPSSLA